MRAAHASELATLVLFALAVAAQACAGAQAEVAAEVPVVETPAEREAPVPIVRRGADLPTHVIAAGRGTAKILYDQGAGSAEVAMTLLVLEPGAAVPTHVHATSVELLYVLQGQAEMRVGAERVVIGPGDAARIPMGVEHEARVLGAVPLRALQVYTPPGPEQRFVPRP